LDDLISVGKWKQGMKAEASRRSVIASNQGGKGEGRVEPRHFLVEGEAGFGTFRSGLIHPRLNFGSIRQLFNDNIRSST
jgi:hypothetical protein